MKVPLLNFVGGGPEVPLLNIKENPGVPLLNFEEGSRSRGPMSSSFGPSFIPGPQISSCLGGC